MIVRRTRVQTTPEKAQQAVALFRDKLLPEIRREPGFRGAVVLINAAGLGQSVTMWADTESERANWQSGQTRREDAARAIGATSREIEVFEEVLSERAPGRSPGAQSFVRYNSVDGEPAKLDAGVAFVRDHVVPVMRTQPGFVALTMGINRDTGRAYVLTAWDTEASREASDAAIRDVRRQSTAALGSTRVQVEEYTIALAELPQPSPAT